MQTPIFLRALGLMAAFTACHRPVAAPEHPDATPTTTATARVVLVADAGPARTVDAAPEPAADGGEKRACAEARDPMGADDVYYTPLSLATLVPVDRNLFSADQLKGKARWSFVAPAQIAWQNTGKDRPPLLAMGDAAWSSCELLAPGPQVKGPFAGAPSSEGWTARVYQGLHRVVVVVSDAAAQARALRAFEVGQVSCGFTLSRLEAFPDGAALHVSSYVSADGDTLMEEGVYGLFGGKLAELFRATASEPAGAVDAFTLTPGQAGDRPTLTVHLKAHPAPKSESLGAMSKTIDRTQKVTWDPKAQRFR